MCALGARASHIELAYLATAVHVRPGCAGVSPAPDREIAEIAA
jgi:hypothetical protein